MQKQASEVEQENRFYSDIDIMKFHKQRTCNGKLNRNCEHVIRHGMPVALTWEQREAFIQHICDIPNRPVRLSDFCGMTVYVCVFLLILPFVFAMGSVFGQEYKNIAYTIYAAGIVLLLIFLAGFIGLCVRISRKGRKRADTFRAEACEKIRRGEYTSYAYRIEEIYRVPWYDDNCDRHYLVFWYRVGDVLFQLPDSTFVYQVGDNDKLLYEEPEKLATHERQHPVGGCVTGMLICLNGREHFFAI